MLDINTIVYKLPIEVDTTKLIGELEALVLPFFKKKADNPNWRTGRPSSNISITGLPNTPLNDWFNANNGAMTVLKDGDTGELLARDSRVLRNYIQQISPDLELKFDFTSDLTGEKEALDIPLGAGFFYPSE